MVKIIVLSMDTEIGEKRRSKLNYDFEWFKSIDGKCIEDRFQFRYNTSEYKKKRIMSVFNSHISILQKIVNEKINDVVVCEDDSIKEFDLKESTNEICLLGGCLRHPNNWKLDTQWRKENDITFEEGVNKIDYSKYRWTQIYAVYYPNWEKTNELLKSILESKKSYCHYDIFLSKNKLINYLYYPTPFKSCDEGISQVDKSQGIVKDYKISKIKSISYYKCGV